MIAAPTVCAVQTKSRREHNVKRALCIGGSLAAVVVLMVLMTGMGNPSRSMASTACPGLYTEYKGRDYKAGTGDTAVTVEVLCVQLPSIRTCDSMAKRVCSALLFGCSDRFGV